MRVCMCMRVKNMRVCVHVQMQLSNNHCFWLFVHVNVKPATISACLHVHVMYTSLVCYTYADI